jgi:hypothetical protein
MKMDAIKYIKGGSALKQLFMWIRNLQELCKSNSALIEQHQEAIEFLENRIANIELLLTQEDNK